MRWTLFFAPTLCLLACDRRPAPAPPPATATAIAPAAATAPSNPRGTPCGALGCLRYDSPRDAFLDAIACDPVAVGVGEVHAPKGAGVPSAAKRFADDLLPLLAGRASDLLVELMIPPSGCTDAVAEVRSKQTPVTARQAETNQNDYVTMGDRARALGIVPDGLRPTCTDMHAIRAAASAIDASLETIARLIRIQAERLVERDQRSDADRGKVLVIFSGAMHNDLAPPPTTASWSYAPELDAYCHGRFVAVDLVVPEFIGQDDTWRSLPWWPYYDGARMGAKTTLFRTGDRSFVLVFPENAALEQTVH